ncbi:hypothetical protein [Streptomyces sp. UH6]|uniref:hypothetical protein n=1 Tax=Streptomyces sp. UH6 TaxID=2748379 RepID=UPI0015D4D297|nr:hypothetical protein [Streptomyces sp. UH6]NYV73317.1 hypothetical protein [Streptomyces sp. UH6]
MTDDGVPQTLFADVCQTLARAGFDIASASAGQATGLRVGREQDAVIVSWVPADELDPAGRTDASYEGIRSALQRALQEILTQAGYGVEADRTAGYVRVSRASWLSADG